MPTPFENAYHKLDSKQKEAVNTIEGPVMVIAGPGTGKTQVLTLRIANILLKTDTEPRNILALTFTDSATKNMRERLSAIIGPDAYKVRVQTFHGFCQSVISDFPEFFPFELGASAITDVEKFQLIRNFLENPELQALRTPGSKYHYVKKILDAISDLKSEGIDPNAFDILVDAEATRLESEKPELSKTNLLKRESMLAKQRELATMYHMYQVKLKEMGCFDFDDMIMQTLKALQENELLRLELQESAHYILVDEYQDTNGAQNKVVDLLSSYWGEQANVFVVGDPNQTVFRFQGASLENTFSFLRRYPQATKITLTQGYRCTQPIYDAAAKLISPTEIALQAVRRDEQKLELATLATPTHEHLFIANDISRRITAGYRFQDLAILVKTNREASEIADVLLHNNIPVIIERKSNILEEIDITQLLTFLRTLFAIRTGSESTELFEVMTYPWLGLDPLLVMKVARTAKSKSLYGAMRTGKEFQELQNFADKLDRWSTLDGSLIFPAFVEQIVKESGYLTWMLTQENKQALVENLATLYTEIKRLSSLDHMLNLEKFLSLLTTMEAQGLPLMRESFTNTVSAVTIATVHKAKGREWNIVYIPHLIDGVWGNSSGKAGLPLPAGILLTQTEDDEESDDRRLLYVAMTRAKQTLVLSHAKTITDQGKVKELLASQFFTQIPRELCALVDTTDFSEKLQFQLEKLVTPPIIHTWSESQRAWLQELVSGFSLSVSTLNTYLRSPKDFYENVLLRVPRAKEPHMAFGTAIHAALEYHYRQYQQNENTHPSIESTTAMFETALAKEVLLPNDHTVRLRQGKKVLSEYLGEKRSEFPLLLATEETFGWRRGKIMIGDIELTGKVDRIDLLDPNGKRIRVIDYKTGKSRTVNEIEGKVGVQDFSARELALPENIRGPYKRQLLFYKLLLSLDRQYAQYEIAQGVFDFVEAKDGKLVDRSFTLEADDMHDLVELIKEVMDEIRNLKFLDQF